MLNVEDMEVITYTSGPPGKVSPVTVRIVHKPSGITIVEEHPHSYMIARRRAVERLRKQLDDARKAI